MKKLNVKTIGIAAAAAAMLVLAGCGENGTASLPQESQGAQDIAAPQETAGTLLLSVNPAIELDYDMAGNVSEWTSTAFTEGVSKLTSDLNPEYRYNAAKEDPYKMKRKIVRGGSWKDVAHNVRSDIRMWEYQNEQRSYIGFRCVRSQIGFARGQQLKSKK